MKLPRPRFTIRKMLLVVAVVAVLMIPIAEESHRRHLVADHAQQELVCLQRNWELDHKARAARAAGRSEEAAILFLQSGQWGQRADGHLRMQRVYGNPWWLFAR